MVKPLGKPVEVQEKKSNFHSIMLFVFVLSVVVFAATHVWKGDEEVAAEVLEEALTERIDKLNNAEQYALYALSDGYYTCSHCSEGEAYLYAGEVAKYGTSINPATRYTSQYLREKNVYYVTQFKGNLQACLEEEARKLYRYYALPENMKRERPLILPPYNSKHE
jgi:hypothetical protein